MSATDYIVDEHNDMVEAADFDFTEDSSDGQHIQDLLQLEPGELLYDPLMGVGIERYINGLADGNLRKNIYLQLQADKYRVNKLLIDNEGNIDIDADRES